MRMKQGYHWLDRSWETPVGLIPICGLAAGSGTGRMGRALLFWNFAGSAWFAPKRKTGAAMSKPISKLALVLALFCFGESSSSAQPGHPGTPQEQQACSRDA